MALGKGLDSLIQSDQDTQQESEERKQEVDSSEDEVDSEFDTKQDQTDPSGHVIEISIEKIKPNPHQPRENFPEDKLEELTQSIIEYGVMQPITVSPIDSGEYELIAGERRFRASKRADQNTIPAIVKDTTEKEKMELALIENLHRHDLSPLEKAQAYRGLMNKFELTQSEVADRVGKSRSSIANMLRLLELPQDIKQSLDEKKISAGQARALLSLSSEVEQLEAFEKLLKEDLNVREIEQFTKVEKSEQDPKDSKSSPQKRKDPNIIAKEEEVEAQLGTKVNIERDNNGEGKIEIDFYSSEDLKRILEDIL